jgi:hypothetical protein
LKCTQVSTTRHIHNKSITTRHYSLHDYINTHLITKQTFTPQRHDNMASIAGLLLPIPFPLATPPALPTWLSPAIFTDTDASKCVICLSGVFRTTDLLWVATCCDATTTNTTPTPAKHTHLYHAQCINEWWATTQSAPCPRCTNPQVTRFMVHARLASNQWAWRDYAFKTGSDGDEDYDNNNNAAAAAAAARACHDDADADADAAALDALDRVINLEHSSPSHTNHRDPSWSLQASPAGLPGLLASQQAAHPTPMPSWLAISSLDKLAASRASFPDPMRAMVLWAALLWSSSSSSSSSSTTGTTTTTTTTSQETDGPAHQTTARQRNRDHRNNEKISRQGRGLCREMERTQTRGYIDEIARRAMDGEVTYGEANAAVWGLELLYADEQDSKRGPNWWC